MTGDAILRNFDPCQYNLRTWRNWQTRQTKDLVPSFGSGGSNPLVRTANHGVFDFGQKRRFLLEAWLAGQIDEIQMPAETKDSIRREAKADLFIAHVRHELLSAKLMTVHAVDDPWSTPEKAQ